MAFNFVFLPPQTDLTRQWAKKLYADIHDIKVSVPEDNDEAAIVLEMADGAFGTLPPLLLPHAGKLRWLHSRQIAPPPGYYYSELVRHPLVVTNTREVFNDHIGAHVLAFVLSFARDFPYYYQQQLQSHWRPKSLNEGVIALPNATALVVGVGGIGAETGRLLAAFGTKVIGVDARRTDAPDGFSELYRPDDLDRLLPTADFVILTVPHTPQTEGMMDRRRFKRMRRSAYFINVGRGMTTKLEDLVGALEAGEIAGAGLDVFENEPLPQDHPLWKMPNVLITPHMAGFGPHIDERRYAILRDNCQAQIAGEPLRNVVDKSKWY
jgi:phosphoglycerate dehydrogenase-like enzyme